MPHPKITLAQQQLDAERWLDEGGSFRAEPVPSAPTADQGNGNAPTTQPAEQYHCLCQHVFQVFGLGRHRRYYELADLHWQYPVMERVCTSFQRPLPAKSTRRATLRV